jgi:hypothetical protein
VEKLTQPSLAERTMAAQARSIYLRGSTAVLTEEARNAVHRSRNLRHHAALLRAASTAMRSSRARKHRLVLVREATLESHQGNSEKAANRRSREGGNPIFSEA